MSVTTTISSSEQKFVIDGCKTGCRQDGRGRDEFRQYITMPGASSVENNLQQPHHNDPPLILSNGSARTFLATGETDVLVSVKAELVVPAISLPDEGVVNVHVDMVHDRHGGDRLESTLANVLIPHLVDTQKLCILPKHYVWRIHLDVTVLQAKGGSLLDVCSRGILAALQTTHLPNLLCVPGQGENSKTVLQLNNNNDHQSKEGICGKNGPVIVTVSMLRSVASVFILDASLEEEACCYAQVHVILDQSSNPPAVCALHKAGGGSLPFSLLQEVTNFISNACSTNNSNGHVAPSGSGDYGLLQGCFLPEQTC